MLAYIGSASEEEDESEEDEILEDDGPDADMRSTTSRGTTKQGKRDAMRAALGLDLEPIPRRKGKKEDRTVGDMQITFTPALSASKQNNGSVFENAPPPPEETTAEKYKRKERERKAARKERSKAKRENPDGEVEPAAVKGQGSKNDEDEEDSADSEQEGSEDAFNDPFFEDPKAVQEEARALRKAEKARLRQEREKDLKASSAQRAELELLMMDDDAAATKGGVQHFSMKEIERAEKAAGKKKQKKKLFKNKKKSAREEEEAKSGAVVDDFKIEVKDPRFASLFESHEFAIDPTNPRFRDTKGMRTLLEETRRRRTEQIERPESKKRAREQAKDDGVLALADKVKKRIKQ
jgi:hypothetical protein